MGRPNQHTVICADIRDVLVNFDIGVVAVLLKQTVGLVGSEYMKIAYPIYEHRTRHRGVPYTSAFDLEL